MEPYTFTSIADFLNRKEAAFTDTIKHIQTMLSKYSSATLNELGNKIEHMAGTRPSKGIGSPTSVMPFLERIVYRGVKGHCKPDWSRYGLRDESDCYGRVHFRWNSQGYTLTPSEIENLKEIILYLKGD